MKQMLADLWDWILTRIKRGKTPREEMEALVTSLREERVFYNDQVARLKEDIGKLNARLRQQGAAYKAAQGDVLKTIEAEMLLTHDELKNLEERRDIIFQKLTKVTHLITKYEGILIGLGTGKTSITVDQIEELTEQSRELHGKLKDEDSAFAKLRQEKYTPPQAETSAKKLHREIHREQERKPNVSALPADVQKRLKELDVETE